MIQNTEPCQKIILSYRLRLGEERLDGVESDVCRFNGEGIFLERPILLGDLWAVNVVCFIDEGWSGNGLARTMECDYENVLYSDRKR